MKSILSASLIALIVAVSPSCVSDSSVASTAAVERSGVWIDARGAGEFADGHLDGAVNIPHDQVGERIAEIASEKDTEIHVYCRSGRRSGVALKTLEEMGYTNVTNEGGYADLK